VAERFAHHVAAIGHGNHRRFMRLPEVVVSRFQLLPEIREVGIFVPRHVGIGHAERIDAHLNVGLAED